MEGSERQRRPAVRGNGARPAAGANDPRPAEDTTGSGPVPDRRGAGRIEIFDTTLRDGEQSPGASLATDEKLRLARQLDALGVDVIEAGFPASSPGDFASVRRIAREVRRPVIAGLARATAADIDRAAAALEGAERARLHVFIATSEIHLRHKLRIEPGECVERAAAAVERAAALVDDVEFSAEDATRTDPAFLCRVVEAAIAAGATTINIPDTVGYAYPSEFRRLIETLVGAVPELGDVTLSVHCHDDLGLAVANSLVAVEAGARQVECTINGIGERAGNAALEEIVMTLRVRGDLLPYETNVDTREIHPTSRLLTRCTGIRPQPNKAIVGRNAFAHEAGIHQDGMIKHRDTYEIVTPRMVGAQRSRLVLGKHSGRRALAKRFRELGYEMEDREIDRIWATFKRLADRGPRVLDEDLIELVHPGALNGGAATGDVYALESLRVVTGRTPARARVRLRDPDGYGRAASGEGDGPVAAVFEAFDTLVGFRVELEDLTIRAAMPGRDAIGETTVRLRLSGQSFRGRGASVDVVEASALAFLDAVNKAVRARRLEAEALAEAGELWGV